MRLAVLHGAPLPSRAASTVQIMKMCEAFAAQGHTVRLVVPNHREVDEGVSDLHAHYGVKASFTIMKAVWPRMPGREYVSASHMALIARRHRPDLVYARYPIGAWACAFANMPVVFEAHRPASQLTRPERWAVQRLMGHDRLVRVVVISQPLRQIFVQHFPGIHDRITVAHDGADIGRCDERHAPRSAEARLQVGYVGNLFRGRGVELIIELASRCDFADFHLIGGSPSDVERWRAVAQRVTNVTFHGFLPHPMAQQQLCAFDVVLAPYGKQVAIYGDATADTSPFMSPLKLFEYMAAGKAIICSDHPVLTEIICHGRTALICRSDDVADWERGLRSLAHDETFRRRLGEAARAECESRFTWTARARHVLSESVGNRNRSHAL